MENFAPKSFHLQWHITEKCNLHCRHCYQDPNLFREEESFSNLNKILKDFIEQIKEWRLSRELVKISLTGGEPMMREDFFQILEQFHANHKLFEYGVLTNGLFLNKENVKKLKNLKISYAQISIEGGKEIHDHIRGKNSFTKAIAGAKLLSKEGIDTNLSLTATKFNIKEIPKVISLARSIDAKLSIKRCVYHGAGKQMKEFVLDPQEVKELWHYIYKINQKTKKSFIRLGCEDGIFHQDIKDYKTSGCSAGYLSFTVLPNGDVYPCRRLPIFSGNLLKNSFKDIYYNSENLKKLRNYRNINDTCYDCSFFEKCFGGAKCLSFSHFQDISAPDPHCWKLFNSLPDPKKKWKNSSANRKERMNHKMIKFQ